jgi:glycosyltransferase involved in cell wall biosynthesis
MMETKGKRLLYFASCYGSGLATLFTDQACVLRGMLGEDLLCVTDHREQFPGLFERLQANSVPVRVIPSLDTHANLRGLVAAVAAIMAEFRPDVVQAMTNWQLAIAALARRKARQDCRIVYWVHGYRHNHPVKSVIATALIGAALALVADKVVVSSSCVRRRFRFLGNKLQLLFLGADPPFFEGYRPIEFAGKTKRLIFAGQFREGKNQDKLIGAVAEYCQRTGDRDVELVLPGDGPLLGACRRLAERLGIGSNVVFPGLLDRDGILGAYLRAHVAVVPSNHETFGHCIEEPMVLGRVVLSRRVGCAEDCIVDGENGFLFDSQEDLVELLVSVLPDPAKCAAVAERARASASCFRWERICEEYVGMLNGL